MAAAPGWFEDAIPAAVSGGTEVAGCPDCGLIQRIVFRADRGEHKCRRCDAVLERTNGRSLDAALACSLATFFLLFPANLLPLLQVSFASKTNHSLLLTGFVGIWRQDWPLIGAICGVEVVVLPFLRFGLLALVLSLLRLGVRRPWLGPAFRWAELLDRWAMMDVFLIGGLVGYARVQPSLPTQVGTGGWCVVVVALLTLVTRASLDRRALWRRIGPVEREFTPGLIGCYACDYPAPAACQGRACPRCGVTLWRRRPFSVMRATALTVAGFVFYPAAYLYPMESNIELGTPHPFTIMTGVGDLIQARLWFFAAVVFTASVLIPLLKLFAMIWFAVSVLRRSGAHLKLKTRLYRIVNDIGRWSHVDVYTVSVFLPLMYVPGLLSVQVGDAMAAFLAVVVITMTASELFDPRAMWLAAGERRQ